MTKVVHEFKPGEALTADGLNDVQAKILDQLNAASAAAAARNDQLQAAVDEVAKRTGADLKGAQAALQQKIDALQASLTADQQNLTLAKTTLQQLIDQTAKTAAANLQTAQTGLQQKIDALQTSLTTDQQSLTTAKTTLQQSIDQTAKTAAANLQSAQTALQAAIDQMAKTAPGGIQQQVDAQRLLVERMLRTGMTMGAQSVLTQAQGAAHLEGQFETRGGVGVMFVAWSGRKGATQATESVNMTIKVDERVVGEVTTGIAETTSNRVLVAHPVLLTELEAKKHKVSLELGPAVTKEDLFDVMVLELPFLGYQPTVAYLTGSDVTVPNPISIPNRISIPIPIPIPPALGTTSRILIGSNEVDVPFETHGGAIFLIVHGSVYRSADTGPIGVDVYVDQERVGACLRWTNHQQLHKALTQSAIAIPRMLPGQHRLHLKCRTASSARAGDSFSVVILEGSPLFPITATHVLAMNEENKSMAPTEGTIQTKGGTLVLFVSGSGWCDSDREIGMDVLVDSTVVGSSRVYCKAGSHEVFVPAGIVVQGLPRGDHRIKLVARTGTNMNYGDYFDVMGLELPVW